MKKPTGYSGLVVASRVCWCIGPVDVSRVIDIFDRQIFRDHTPKNMRVVTRWRDGQIMTVNRVVM